MIKLCFIGHFGGDESFREGQTIKTQNIAEVLNSADCFRVKYVDTYYYKRNILKFCWQLVAGLFSCKRVILCVSAGGRSVFFPLLYWCAKLFKKKIYHFLIGGRLAEEAEEKTNWKKYISAFSVNWVESHLIADRLNAIGVTNAEYLPNFKNLPVLSDDVLACSLGDVKTFCMFCRITEEKGVTEAIESVASINQKYGRVAAKLDLYGPVAPAYEEKLNLLLAEHSDCILYRGVTEPESSVDVLRNYEMLLFPTQRFREGIPGTIIDALCSGVPVIARKWKYCHEMLSHGYNGFWYEFDQPEKLVYWLEYAMEHPEEVYEMKKNCLSSADQYRTENVAPIILQKLAEK